jgi:hypothetical protein
MLSSLQKVPSPSRGGPGWGWGVAAQQPHFLHLIHFLQPERNIPAYKPGVEPSIQTAPAAFA